MSDEKAIKTQKKRVTKGPKSFDHPTLNPKEALFCQEYVIDMNATRAYRAVYGTELTYGSCRTYGSRLLTKHDIQDEITRLFKEMAERGKVRAEMVIRELANIAFGDISVVAQWDDNGLELKASDQLTRDNLALIKEVQSTPVGSMGQHIGNDKRVKLHDKMKALEILAKHFNLLQGALDDENARKPFALAYDSTKLKDFIEHDGEPDKGHNV
jgi:phage terminase small subunit